MSGERVLGQVAERRRPTVIQPEALGQRAAALCGACPLADMCRSKVTGECPPESEGYGVTGVAPTTPERKPYSRADLFNDAILAVYAAPRVKPKRPLTTNQPVRTPPKPVSVLRPPRPNAQPRRAPAHEAGETLPELIAGMIVGMVAVKGLARKPVRAKK